MSDTVVFDGYSLDTSERITESLTTRSAPKRLVERARLAAKDGTKVVSALDDEKIITWRGFLKTTTASGLRGLIDEVKQALTKTEKTLAVTEADVTREYVCSLVDEIEIGQEHYEITAAPIEVQFLAADPYCYDQAYTTWSGTSISGTSWTQSLTLSGSAAPAPRLTVDVSISGAVTEIKLTNNDEWLSVSRPTGQYGFGDNAQLIIDCQAQTVTLSGVNVTFSGVLPSFTPGLNVLKLGFAHSSAYQYDNRVNLTLSYRRRWR